MPHDRQNERVLVIQVDRDGNVKNYETSNRQVAPVKSSTIYHSQPSRVKRIIVHDKESNKYYKDNNYVQEKTSFVTVPVRNTREDIRIKTPPRRRRLRYVPPVSTVKIFDESPDWHGQPKVDSHNERSNDLNQNRRKPVIFDESHAWLVHSKTDNYNEDYAKYKERTRPHRQEKPYHFAQQRRSKIDNHNLEYDDRRRKHKSTKLPPINHGKSAWTRNDDRMERTRQYRSTSAEARKRSRWHFISSKVDTHNEELADYVQAQPTPRIVNELPRWRSKSRVDAINDFYDANQSNIKPRIFNEKIRWHARSKIDTGFEPDSYSL